MQIIIPGLQRLKLDPAENYSLVYFVDGIEKPVESFESLPPDSVLKFKENDESLVPGEVFTSLQIATKQWKSQNLIWKLDYNI